MITIAVHHNQRRLPKVDSETIPVQLYSWSGYSGGQCSVIGNQIIEKVKSLGVRLTPALMDFLSISLAVTAADTFVPRKNAADGWTREILVTLPLHNPGPWVEVKTQLESVMNFLSGDIWRFEFSSGGMPPPIPFYKKIEANKRLKVANLDSVCLFSGGLDSAVGAIDLLAQNRRPLLVSYAYKGDSTYQKALISRLRGKFAHFSLNADPHSITRKTEISMRTRSLGFLAFALLGCYALEKRLKIENVPLFMPENGFISINAPLTSRRIGSFSTRTTHPQFLSQLQSILLHVGISTKIYNPYQFKTKGEMIKECRDNEVLQRCVNHTVSCSHWKRKNRQCGVCVPCLVRRASLTSSQCFELNNYSFQNIKQVLSSSDARDDLFAVLASISQVENRNIGSWILDSGELPEHDFENYKAVFVRGIDELKHLLIKEGLIC